MEERQITRAELEKIITGLELKAKSLNDEIATLRKDRQATIDALNGEARTAKIILEQEIAELTEKKSDLQNIITAGLAENTAERIRLAAENEKLKTVLTDLVTRETAVKNALEDLDAKDIRLTSEYQELNRLKNDLDQELKQTRPLIDKAKSDSNEAERMLKVANEKMAEAERSVQDLTDAAEKRMRDAKAILEQAEADRAVIDAQHEEVKALIAEYKAKLSESQEWAKANSDLSAKLSVWERALRREDERLLDDKGKLAIAEQEFAAKTKGEK